MALNNNKKVLTIEIDGIEKSLNSMETMERRAEAIDKAFSGLGKTDKELMKTLQGLQKTMDVLQRTMYKAVMASDEVAKALKEQAVEAKNTASDTDKLDGSIRNIDKSTKSASKSLRGMNLRSLRGPVKELSAEFATLSLEGIMAGKTTKESFEDAAFAVGEAAMAFGPYGVAAGLAITALTPLVSKMFELTDAQKDAASLTEAYTKSIVEETAEMDALFVAMEDVNITERQRKELIDQINAKYGQYLPNLLTEKSTAEEIATAYDAVKVSLQELAFERGQAAVAESIYIEQAEKAAEIQRKIAVLAKPLETVRRSGDESAIADIERMVEELRNKYAAINRETVTRIEHLNREADIQRDILGLQNKQELAAKRQFRANNRNYELTVKNLRAHRETLRAEYMATEGLVGQGLGALGIEVNTDSGFEEYFNELLKRAQSAEDRQISVDNATKKSSDERNRLLDRQLEQFKLLNENLQKAFSSAEGAVGEAERKVDEFATEKELNKAILKATTEIAKVEKKITEYKAEALGSDNKANRAAKERLDLAQKELNTRKQIHDDVILQAGAERDAETKLYNERMAMLGKAQKEFDAKGSSIFPYDLNHVLDQNPQLVKKLGAMGKDQYDVVSELQKALKGESIAITEEGTGKYRAYGEKGDPETLLLAAIRTFVENNGNIYAGKLYAASGGKVQTTSSVTAAKTMADDVYIRTIRESGIDVEKAQAAFDKAQEEYNKLGGIKNKEAEAALNEAEAKLVELKKRQADLEGRRAEVIAEQTAEEAKFQAQLAGDSESQKIVEERYKTFRNYLDALNIQYQNEIDATAEEIRKSDNAKKLASLLGITVEELVTADGGLGVVDFDEEDLRKMGASEETMKFFDAFSKSVEMQYDNLYEENLNRIRSSAETFVKELRAALPEEMRKSIDETRIAAESARLHYETTTAGLYRVNADGSRTEMTSTDVLARIQELNTQMDKASGKKLKELTEERDMLASMVLDLLKDAQRLEMEALQRSTIDIIQEIRNRAGEDGWSEAKIAEETELAMRDAMNKVKDLELRQSKELESVQSTLEGKKGEGFNWKIIETKLKESSTQILSIAGTVFSTIGSIRDYFIQALNDSIDALTTKMDALESESDRIASKISELEDDLVGKRSGRRDAILQALEQERLKEEEVAKAKIGLAEELAKKEKELADQERARAKEQLYMDLARAISNVALGITNALASSGLLGIIQGVAIGAAGAVQTGIIAKQIGAFAEGGFTGNGEGPRDSTGYKQAGVVHEGEWVAPKWMVNSPSFGSVIQSLESSRQRGFADGGMVSADYNGMSNAVNNNTTMQRQMNALMGAAIDMANRPTYVSVTDINNVNMKQAKRVKASRIGG